MFEDRGRPEPKVDPNAVSAAGDIDAHSLPSPSPPPTPNRDQPGQASSASQSPKS